MTNRIECVLHGYCAFGFTALWSTSSSLVLFDLLYCPFLVHVVLKVEWLYMAAYEKTATLCSGPTVLLLFRVLHFLPRISHTHTLIITISWFLSFRHYLWTTMENKRLMSFSTSHPQYTHRQTQALPISLFFNCDETSIQCLPYYVYVNTFIREPHS